MNLSRFSKSPDETMKENQDLPNNIFNWRGIYAVALRRNLATSYLFYRKVFILLQFHLAWEPVSNDFIPSQTPTERALLKNQYCCCYILGHRGTPYSFCNRNKTAFTKYNTKYNTLTYWSDFQHPLIILGLIFGL